jgi:hypothetical protein
MHSYSRRCVVTVSQSFFRFDISLSAPVTPPPVTPHPPQPVISDFVLIRCVCKEFTRSNKPCVCECVCVCVCVFSNHSILFSSFSPGWRVFSHSEISRLRLGSTEDDKSNQLHDRPTAIAFWKSRILSLIPNRTLSAHPSGFIWLRPLAINIYFVVIYHLDIHSDTMPTTESS